MYHRNGCRRSQQKGQTCGAGAWAANSPPTRGTTGRRRWDSGIWPCEQGDLGVPIFFQRGRGLMWALDSDQKEQREGPNDAGSRICKSRVGLQNRGSGETIAKVQPGLIWAMRGLKDRREALNGRASGPPAVTASSAMRLSGGHRAGLRARLPPGAAGARSKARANRGEPGSQKLHPAAGRLAVAIRRGRRIALRRDQSEPQNLGWSSRALTDLGRPDVDCPRDTFADCGRPADFASRLARTWGRSA